MTAQGNSLIGPGALGAAAPLLLPLFWAVILASCGPAAGPTAPDIIVSEEASAGGEQPEDRDGDRIAEGDRCPDEREVYNGFEDDDGCPDRGPPENCVHVDVLHIAERIQFPPNSSALDEAEMAILQALTDALANYPGIGVGVAASASPGDESAAALGEDRITAVRQALIERGVAGDRLDRVIADAAGLDDQVWFPILSIDGEAVAEDRPATRLLPHAIDCEAEWERWRDEGTALNCDCRDQRPAWAEAMGADRRVYGEP